MDIKKSAEELMAASEAAMKGDWRKSADSYWRAYGLSDDRAEAQPIASRTSQSDR
jgi:hypothetical protein